MLQRIVRLGTNTKISQEQYLEIFALLSVNRGPLDFYLMPSLNLWMVSAGSFVPQEGCHRGVFLGRFDANCDISSLSEQLDYAIEEACHLPEVETPQTKPEEQAAPARVSVESAVTVDGTELTLGEHTRRRRPGWASTPFHINKRTGLKSGGTVTQAVV